MPSIIPEGATVTFTAGSHDKNTLVGVFKATRSINADEQIAAYLAEDPARTSSYAFDELQFAFWLVLEGMLTVVHCVDWHFRSADNVHDPAVWSVTGGVDA